MGIGTENFDDHGDHFELYVNVEPTWSVDSIRVCIEYKDEVLIVRRPRQEGNKMVGSVHLADPNCFETLIALCRKIYNPKKRTMKPTGYGKYVTLKDG